jgi:phosphoribosylglycinamide formyltransferase-1
MSNAAPKNIAVLVSGHGTNLQAIINAQEAGLINGKIVLVISNKVDAFALERAKKAGIQGMFINPKTQSTNEDYDKQLVQVLTSYKIDLIVLAGWLRILTSELLVPYHNRIINIHPSLLPSFGGAGMYGMNVHRAALEYGVKYTGATAHFVDDNVDGGAVIDQSVVKVDYDDTPETLHSKVIHEEHRLLTKVVRAYCDDKIAINGRQVHIID